MTSVTMSAICVILAIILLIILCMKGLNVIPVAIICAFIVSLTVEGGPVEGLFTFFSDGFASFGGSLIMPFMTGGMFGALMMATGSDVKIGQVLINKFGSQFAVYSFGIFVAILAYVGIPSYPFLGAILAFSLMKAANLPRNVACVVMVGTASAFQYILPGSPTVINLIAGQSLGTGLYAGWQIGFIMAAVQLVLVYMYVELVMVRGYRKKGIGYTGTDMELELKGQQDEIKDEDLPSFGIAVFPLLAVIVLCMVFQLGLKMDAYPSCAAAQTIGMLLIILLNLKHGIINKVISALSKGCLTSCVPLIQTCCVVGFATVITNTACYNAMIDGISNMNMNPYVMTVLGTALLAGVSADAVNGVAMGSSIIGVKAVAAGADPGLVHRLVCAAATTLDTMPHAGGLNVSMNFMGLTHKEVYLQIVVVQIGATSAATLIGMVIAMLIG
jgi:H+/gluconate symporter-like permease